MQSLLLLLVLVISLLAVLSQTSRSRSARRADIIRHKRNDQIRRPLGAIMMLLSDWKTKRGRTCYFNASMDALSGHWRPNNKYPIILMNTEPWKWKDMSAIRRKWNTLDFKFININDVFNYNPIAPLEELEDALKPLSNIAYKRMCHFFFSGFMQVPVLMQYKYLMRMDDDTCILDNINYDMFQMMEDKNAAYAYTSTWFDGDFVSKGMYSFADAYVAERNLSWMNEDLHQRIVRRNKFPAFVPAYNTNLEIINSVRYSQQAVVNFLEAVTESDLIFHRRWGDAPLRFVLSMLFWPEKDVIRLDSFDFQHSTWPVSPMTETPLEPKTVL